MQNHPAIGSTTRCHHSTLISIVFCPSEPLVLLIQIPKTQKNASCRRNKTAMEKYSRTKHACLPTAALVAQTLLNLDTTLSSGRSYIIQPSPPKLHPMRVGTLKSVERHAKDVLLDNAEWKSSHPRGPEPGIFGRTTMVSHLAPFNTFDGNATIEVKCETICYALHYMGWLKPVWLCLRLLI